MLICLGIGLLAGLINAVLIARAGIPSLVVTLAMLIGFRGFARVLVKDQSYGDFPDWVSFLGQKGVIGPIPLSIWVFLVLLVLLGILLHRSGFGLQVVVVGTNAEVARFSGLNVARVKTMLYLMSGLISALAGLLYAARLGSVRGDIANGFELDIITMVLLGGVSIFGGKGSMTGVFLSILIILNLRNGMALNNITGHIQTGVIGCLLIASVLVPNLIQDLRQRRSA
jgi:rhamnose transport system permease protein